MLARIRNSREIGVQLFLQLVIVFAVGATIGAEKTIVSTIGTDVYGIESFLLLGTFVITFGFVKAALNLVSGRWSEVGRKRVLVAGWLVALPIPVILVLAPNWWWIAAANILLGANQGMTFSMSVNSAIDLAGPDDSGLAVGLVESIGYGGVAVSALVSGIIASTYGLRPAPFYFLGGVIVVALILSVVFVRDTLAYTESTTAASGTGTSSTDDTASTEPVLRDIITRSTYGDRTFFAACLAGHVEKFVDALVWIAYPIFLASTGLSLAQVGVIVFVYNGTWALLQIPAGRIADRIGRRVPIVSGLFIAGAGVLATVLVRNYLLWAIAAAATGAGIALLYPNLQAVFSDRAAPSWRATGIGVYRMWRDAGYGIGAIVIGVTVDLFSIKTAFYVTAAAMAVSGCIALFWLEESRPRSDSAETSVGEPNTGSTSD
jgi:MFS family permease